MNPATQEAVPTDTEVVYDPSTGEFGSSFEIKNPAITGSFEIEGIKVRTVYDAAVEQIKPFTVEFAAEECGLPVDQVRELCELYATSKPAKIISWCGFEHVENSWRLYLDAPFLASLSGNACIPGGGYVGGYTPASSVMKKPVTLNMKAAQEGESPTTGFTLEYLPQVLETGKWAGEDFPISGLFISGDAVLSSRMGSVKMIEAFKKLDFLIVADPFMTYTAQYADLVFPISLSWERNDHNRSFMQQKAVEPMGEARSDFDMYKAIAEAMGYNDLYPKEKEEYLREVLDTPENIEAGVAYDDYAEQGVILGEYKEAVVTSTESNPTGRTQFFLERIEPNNDWGQVYELADRIPNYVHTAEAYKDNPLREKYPLFAISGHSIYFGHTQTSHCLWLDEVRGYKGEPFIRIHEKAAAERGISTGDTVKAFNDHGYLIAKAVLTTGIREDTILLPRGFETDQYIEGHPQNLTSIILDSVTGNANYDDVLCQIEKL